MRVEEEASGIPDDVLVEAATPFTLLPRSARELRAKSATQLLQKEAASIKTKKLLETREAVEHVKSTLVGHRATSVTGLLGVFREGETNELVIDWDNGDVTKVTIGDIYEPVIACCTAAHPHTDMTGLDLSTQHWITGVTKSLLVGGVPSDDDE